MGQLGLTFTLLWPAFLAGLTAGWIVAFPLGPVGQLAARLTTEKKRRHAREIAYTCVVLDSLIALLLLTGVSWLPHINLNEHAKAMGVIGLLLILLGLELWRTAPSAPVGQVPGGFKRPWHFAVAYTLLHPGSLLALATAFALMHTQSVLTSGLPSKAACWLGVTMGSFAAWAFWIALIHHLKRTCNQSMLRLIFARGLAGAVTIGGVLLIWQSNALPHLLEWADKLFSPIGH